LQKPANERLLAHRPAQAYRFDKVFSNRRSTFD